MLHSFASVIAETATLGLDTSPVAPAGLQSTRQRPSIYFLFNWSKSSILIISWSLLATMTATALSVSLIIDIITFALLTAIVFLCDYALILGIQLIHFFMDLKLEPLVFHPNELNLE